jgi:RNA polymerase sigma-70 factor (ECF subfamily)
MSVTDERERWLPAAYEEHRGGLHAHCYRLTGNVADADDLVQETFLRAWRSRDAFEGRASARTWLFRIATNVFLDNRKAASQRTTPVGDVLEWSTEIGPYPDPSADFASRETVELALIAALMYLPARQRAAFILRDVYGWTPAEVAEALGAAVPAVNSLVQRARETVRRHAPADPARWRRPPLTSEDEEIVRRYRTATDPAHLIDLLAEDVRITMPPDAPVSGREEVAEFLTRPLDWRTFPAVANGRPALINYLRQPGTEHYDALTVDVLRIVDGKIAEINAFIGPHHVTAFGMPASLGVPIGDSI